MTGYNFAERGLRAELIGKYLYLASTPPAGALLKTLDVMGGGWYGLWASDDGRIQAKVPDSGEPVSMEVYTAQMLPVAIVTGTQSVTADVPSGSGYVVHVQGEPDVIASVELTFQTGQAVPANLTFHNTAWNLDVTGDGRVTPLDALVVINQLNQRGSQLLVGVNHGAQKVDTSGDGRISPIDAMLVINYLNRVREGEAGDTDNWRWSTRSLPRIGEQHAKQTPRSEASPRSPGVEPLVLPADAARDLIIQEPNWQLSDARLVELDRYLDRLADDVWGEWSE
jgi:hypothetical protein